jgi:hypothetical protein
MLKFVYLVSILLCEWIVYLGLFRTTILALLLGTCLVKLVELHLIHELWVELTIGITQ